MARHAAEVDINRMTAGLPLVRNANRLHGAGMIGPSVTIAGATTGHPSTGTAHGMIADAMIGLSRIDRNATIAGVTIARPSTGTALGMIADAMIVPSRTDRLATIAGVTTARLSTGTGHGMTADAMTAPSRTDLGTNRAISALDDSGKRRSQSDRSLRKWAGTRW